MTSPRSSIPPDDADLHEDAPQEGNAIRDMFATEEIFHRVLATARHELERPARTFWWGAVAAGLSIGFCLLARAELTALVGSDGEAVGMLLYPVGFLFVIIGRYPLYTENTLTPVTLALTRFASLPDLLRVWGLSLGGNLVGAATFAALLWSAGLPSGEAGELAIDFGVHLVEAPFGEAFSRAVLAGWLLAGLVWLALAARGTMARILLVWLLIEVQIVCDLFHCVVGSVEVLFAVFHGATSIGAYLGAFLVPAVLGNTVGGVLFVAALNYAQFREEEVERLGNRLTWRVWLFGSSRGG